MGEREMSIRPSDITVLPRLAICIALSLPLACATTPGDDVVVNETMFGNIATMTQSQQASLALFATSGPFRWIEVADVPVTVSPGQTIWADVFRPITNDLSPVVVITHGNGSTKESHSLQAQRLASWGMHVVTVQMPSDGQWVSNGGALAELSRMIHSYPAIVGPRADPSRIVLAGHSFGGSAVVVAAASRGAPIKGLILLDPAAVSDAFLKYLAEVRVPIILIGADPSVFKSRRRDLFFHLSRSPFREVSVRGATHNDAQYPSDEAMKWGPFNMTTSEQRQEAFLQAITASALSLTTTGTTDWAWRSIISRENRNRYFGAREKAVDRN
jgi:pimeloyl-ACP methyl ester carboxylesterase